MVGSIHAVDGGFGRIGVLLRNLNNLCLGNARELGDPVKRELSQAAQQQAVGKIHSDAIHLGAGHLKFGVLDG